MSEAFNSESLLPQEKIDNRQQWDSGHKSVALSTLEKVLPRRIRLVDPQTSEASIKDQVLQKREKLKDWLDAIDNEAVNFTHWMDPGRWPDKWVRGIEQYEKSVNAQMHA